MAIRSIPAEFEKFFWDTNFKSLDADRNKSVVIPRLFTKGGTRGKMWVERVYSAKEIAEVMKHCRNLNPIVANYVSQKYHIPKDEMIYYRFEAMGAKELWPY